MTEYLTLIHDHWRATRKFFLFSLGFMLAIACFSYAALIFEIYSIEVVYANDTQGWMMAPLGIWLLLLIIASGESADLSLTMPRYLTRLPVSTWKIVSARLTFGVASSLMLALLSYAGCIALLQDDMQNYLAHPVLIIAWPLAYLAIQAYTWCFGSMGIIATLTSFLASFLAWNRIFYDYQFNASHYGDYSLGGAMAIIAISIVASVVGVGLQRKGRFSDLQMPTLLKRTTASPDTLDTDTFNSPAEALRWYQHREQSSLYPKLAVAFCLLFFAWSIEPFESGKTPPSDFLPVAIYLGINIASYIAGTMMLLRGWGKLLKKDGIFLFIRPVTSLEMITARWEANAKVVLLTVIPLSAIAIVAFFFDTDVTDEGNIFAFAANHYSAATIVFFCFAVVMLLCLGIWASLWMENIIGICIIFGVVCIPILVIGQLLQMDLKRVETIQVVVMAVAVITLFAALFVHDWRKNLISIKHLTIILVLAPLVCAGAYVTMNFVQILDEEPQDTSVLFYAFAMAMLGGVAPIITGPAITQWARHRK